MNDAYFVEYSKCGNQVCIMPKNTIPYEDFCLLMKLYLSLGYKYWLPTDHRRGYLLSKGKNEPS